jgi:hypothetical protein
MKIVEWIEFFFEKMWFGFLGIVKCCKSNEQFHYLKGVNIISYDTKGSQGFCHYSASYFSSKQISCRHYILRKRLQISSVRFCDKTQTLKRYIICERSLKKM